jgi:transcriptional regulator with XRE-family HTH domain
MIIEKIKLLREIRGWSLAHLARQSYVTKSYLCALENGRRKDENMSVHILRKIAKAFDVPITYFF